MWARKPVRLPGPWPDVPHAYSTAAAPAVRTAATLALAKARGRRLATPQGQQNSSNFFATSTFFAQMAIHARALASLCRVEDAKDADVFVLPLYQYHLEAKLEGDLNWQQCSYQRGVVQQMLRDAAIPGDSSASEATSAIARRGGADHLVLLGRSLLPMDTCGYVLDGQGGLLAGAHLAAQHATMPLTARYILGEGQALPRSYEGVRWLDLPYAPAVTNTSQVPSVEHVRSSFAAIMASTFAHGDWAHFVKLRAELNAQCARDEGCVDGFEMVRLCRGGGGTGDPRKKVQAVRSTAPRGLRALWNERSGWRPMRSDGNGRSAGAATQQSQQRPHGGTQRPEAPKAATRRCFFGQGASASQEVRGAAITTYSDATFCLVPSGDLHARGAMVDAMSVGCVPVFFHAEQLETWPIFWGDWVRNASVYISWQDLLGRERGDQTMDVLERLRAIPPAEVAAMRRTIATNFAPRMIFGMHETRGDAVDIALDYVIEKAREAERERTGASWR